MEPFRWTTEAEWYARPLPRLRRSLARFFAWVWVSLSGTRLTWFAWNVARPLWSCALGRGIAPYILHDIKRYDRHIARGGARS